MNDSQRVTLFLEARKVLEHHGFVAVPAVSAFIVERWGDDDHKALAIFDTVDELTAFACGIQKSGREEYRAALLRVIDARNLPHTDGAVGKVTEMYKIADAAIMADCPNKEKK